MKLSYADKKKVHLHGLNGLPDNYPVPNDEQNMLFFIQRNHNFNTVVYQLNLNNDGFIDEAKPLNVYWKEYEDNGNIRGINYLQERLAYGYNHKMINNETIQLSIVSYPAYKIFITLIDGTYKAIAKFKGEWAILTNIYVYAEEFGAFPNVKYVELYGENQVNGLPCFEKLNISE